MAAVGMSYMKESSHKRGTLYVITCFEKVMDYLFKACESSPKKFRYSFVMRIEQLLLEIEECLISANMTRLEDMRRKEHQEKAKMKLTVLSSVLRIAMNQKCIAFSHYENATKLISDTMTYLDKWMKSDDMRRGKLPDSPSDDGV